MKLATPKDVGKEGNFLAYFNTSLSDLLNVYSLLCLLVKTTMVQLTNNIGFNSSDKNIFPFRHHNIQH